MKVFLTILTVFATTFLAADQSGVQDISSSNFESVVLQSKKLVIVDVYSDTCPPCQRQLPILAELARESDDVSIVKVNKKNQADLAQKLGVNAVPTLLFYKNGSLVSTRVGLTDRSTLNAVLKSMKKSS